MVPWTTWTARKLTGAPDFPDEIRFQVNRRLSNPVRQPRPIKQTPARVRRELKALSRLDPTVMQSCTLIQHALGMYVLRAILRMQARPVHQ